MQFKKHLLTGVIASAAIIGLAGTANALTIVSFRLDDTAGGAHDFANPTAALFVPPGIASEIVPTGDTTVGDDRDDGAATVTFDVETGTFPSGNVLLTVTLTGATFDDSTPDGGWFDFTTCVVNPGGNNATAVLSTATTTSATFVISHLNDCGDTNNPTIRIPFDADVGVDVTATIGIVTESGSTPVDGGARTFTILNDERAFKADIDPFVTASGSQIADVAATVLGVISPYRLFIAGTTASTGVATLGDIELLADTDVYVDLEGGVTPIVADAAQVTRTITTITGNMAAVAGATGALLIEGVAAVDTATQAVADSDVTAAFMTNLVVTGAAFLEGGADDEVDFDVNSSTPIAVSTYSASIATELVAGLEGTPQAGPLTPITRNGTNAILPWTASNTQSAGTGSQNFVRVSNPTGLAYGLVIAEVLASTNAATVGAKANLANSVAAGGEVLFTAAQLETALGNFGRADIIVTVEGNGATIKRLVQRPDGSYEINNVGVNGVNAN